MMRFEWDETKAAVNLAKHGVSFNEAATVLGDTLGWGYPHPEHSLAEERGRHRHVGKAARPGGGLYGRR